MKLSAGRIFTILILAAATMAADDGVRGPVSGLLVDEQAGSIRPIVGIPGAAYAGAASVRDVEFVSAAPDGRNALVVKQGALYVVRRLDAETPVWRMIRDEAGPLGRAAWSEDAGALALLNPESNRLELWRHLADQPETAGSVDLAELRGRLVSLAVDRDGRYAFATVQESEEAAALYLLKPDESPRLMVPLERAGAMLLQHDALYLADPGRNEILRLTDWDFAYSLTTVATAGHGVEDPIGLALSDDGKTLFVANGESRQILALDADRQILITALDLDFRPTGMQRTGNVFLIADGVAGKRPAQVLDPARLEVFFIPVSGGL